MSTTPSIQIRYNDNDDDVDDDVGDDVDDDVDDDDDDDVDEIPDYIKEYIEKHMLTEKTSSEIKVMIENKQSKIDILQRKIDNYQFYLEELEEELAEYTDLLFYVENEEKENERKRKRKREHKLEETLKSIKPAFPSSNIY